MCTLDLPTVFGLTLSLTPQRMALFQSYMQRVLEGTYFRNYKVVEA